MSVALLKVKLTETVITNSWLYCDTQSQILMFDITLNEVIGVHNWTLGNGGKKKKKNISKCQDGTW